MGIIYSGSYFLALETVTQLQGLVPFGVQYELCKTQCHGAGPFTVLIAFGCLGIKPVQL